MVHYPQYTGFDVSETAVRLCKKRFKNDTAKTFALLQEYTNQKAELVISLDVLYHLIEDTVFEEYIERLFCASSRFVIIYAGDFDRKSEYHVRCRKFTGYIEEHITGWSLMQHIPNKYPYDENKPDITSWSDFYIYTKQELP